MVVTCENCATRFKFDERRIKPGGIKVHCSRCRRTFLLLPPGGAQPAAETSATTEAPADLKREVRSAPPPPATAAPVTPAPGEAVPAREEPPAPPAETLPAAEGEVYGDGNLPDDDPLADVPGFDPDAVPSLPRSGASEEEKALEALTRDEQLESGVSEALDRFGVSPLEEGGGDSGSPEGGPPAQDAEQPGTARGEEDAGPDSMGADGEDIEVGGADGPDEWSGNDRELDVPGLDGDDDQESGGAADEFDWDQVSFAKDKTGPDIGAAEAEGETDEGDETDFIERNDHESGAGSAAGNDSAAATGADLPGPREADALELDLSATAPERLRAPETPPPAVQTPAAPAGGAALDLASSEAPGVDAPASAKPAAVKKPRPVVIPPLRLRARPDRGKLVVPRLAGLALSMALGLVAAAAGAMLTSTPGREASQVARPAGEPAGRTALVIEDARGVTIDRLRGGALYLVTGTARWEEPAQRASFLEGIIVDDAGEVLERRPARLGERPDWEAIEGIDPDLFAPVTPLPADGETPFSMLFAPGPSWQGEVRFEVRPGR